MTQRKWSIVIGCGLGLLAVTAALPATALLGTPNQPVKVVLNDSRVLSAGGTYNILSGVHEKQVVTLPGGEKVTYFPQVGYATIDMTLGGQKKSKVKFEQFDLNVSSYGYDGLVSGNDMLNGSKSGKLGLSKQGLPSLSGDLALKKSTKVDFNASGYTLSGYNYTGTTLLSLFPKSTIANGVAKSVFGINKLFLSGAFDLPDGGPLNLDVTWTNPTKGKGTVVFTSPTWLAGKAGTVKQSDPPTGKLKIEGPKGFDIEITVNADGSGVADLGYGKFDVPVGGFKLFDT